MSTNQNRTATRPERTVNNERFGNVRADEVRVRDIVIVIDWNENEFYVTVNSVKWVGDDIQFGGYSTGGTGFREWTWETSEGNGVQVVGHKG
jgi:hypothetical protein